MSATEKKNPNPDLELLNQLKQQGQAIVNRFNVDIQTQKENAIRPFREFSENFQAFVNVTVAKEKHYDELLSRAEEALRQQKEVNEKLKVELEKLKNDNGKKSSPAVA